jgi:hypothetical protein
MYRYVYGRSFRTAFSLISTRSIQVLFPANIRSGYHVLQQYALAIYTLYIQLAAILGTMHQT